METIFDLPAHPLLVHIPVVLLPLVATVAAVVAARPTWRRRYGYALAGSVAVVLVSILFTMSSGEALNDALEGRIPSTDKHRDLAETTRALTIGLFVAVAAMVGLDQWSARARGRVAMRSRLASHAFGLATVVLAVLSTIWLVRTGHEGARITWEGTIQ